MHFANNIQNWPDGLRGTFPFLVKAIDRGDILREAKQTNPNVVTVLRHWYDGGQVFGGDWEANLARARAFLATFIDGTFRDQYAPYVDYIEEFNEFLANSQNETEIAERVLWVEAVAWVWKHEYRVKPEYAHIRLVICNAAVGNWIDRSFAEIARDYDCIMGYHPYTLWERKVRWDGDWLNLSGLWDVMESEWGIKVNWMFTECGPFQAAEDGWRSPECLGGDRALLVEAMRQWVADVKTTDAYREGRIVGTGAWFTSGGGSQWDMFELTATELVPLGDMFEAEWTPVEPEPEPEPEPVAGNLGIDVSQWQGAIDWQAVAAAGYKYAFIRATIGSAGLDTSFQTNWNGAKAAGLLCAPYHLFKPDQDAAYQAAYLYAMMAGKSLDMPPALDVELANGVDAYRIAGAVGTCARECERLFGVKPVIYTARWFWDANVSPTDVVADCPLWVANYTIADEPVMPSGWDAWTFWQYDSGGELAGIPDNSVDLNRFSGTHEELLAWLASVMPQPVDPPDPEPVDPVDPAPVEPAPVQPVPVEPVEQPVVYVSVPKGVVVKVAHYD